MTLNANEPFQLPTNHIVVNHYAHHLTIEDLNQSIAAGYQVKAVPVISLDQCFECSIIA